jgi:hypothetical protein
MHDVITVHPATTTILLHILKNITFTMAEIDWNDVTRHLLASITTMNKDNISFMHRTLYLSYDIIW